MKEKGVKGGKQMGKKEEIGRRKGGMRGGRGNRYVELLQMINM